MRLPPLANRPNKSEPVNTDFEDKAKVVIVVSGVHYRKTASQYRTYRSECEQLAKHFKVPNLQDLQKKRPQLEEPCANKFQHRLQSRSITSPDHCGGL